jgi:hypothetical protein
MWSIFAPALRGDECELLNLDIVHTASVLRGPQKKQKHNSIPNHLGFSSQSPQILLVFAFLSLEFSLGFKVRTQPQE